MWRDNGMEHEQLASLQFLLTERTIDFLQNGNSINAGVFHALYWIRLLVINAQKYDNTCYGLILKFSMRCCHWFGFLHKLHSLVDTSEICWNFPTTFHLRFSAIIAYDSKRLQFLGRFFRKLNWFQWKCLRWIISHWNILFTWILPASPVLSILEAILTQFPQTS